MIRRGGACAVAALAVAAAVAAPAFALAPDAPSSVVVTPLSTTLATGPLSVSFVPGADNGSPISSFTASCVSSNGGVAGSASNATSPIVVANLTTAMTYRCSVTATNGDGVSAASTSAPGIVGAPAPPRILRTLPFTNGIAIAFFPGANNGSPIVDYRARCTSTNGGVPGSPLQLVSPIVATGLTNGAIYSCVVSAKNARGAGPAVIAGPVTVNPPPGPTWASCTGSAGSVVASPGLLLTAAQPVTFALSATLSSCTGPFVAAGRMTFSFRTPSEVTCQNLLKLNDNGYGTMTWTAPAAMGRGTALMHFIVTSTNLHVTKVHLAGVVTSKSNLFTGRTLTGDITLNRGLHATASGGDCTVTIPLRNFGLTAVTLTVT